MKTRAFLLAALFLAAGVQLSFTAKKVSPQHCALQQKLSEEKKIELLIRYVSDMPGAIFVRNGSNHTPAEAAEHLRLKRKNAGSKVKTAREFIERCATKSSVSGKPYTIITADGLEKPAAQLLTEELRRIEKTNR